MTEYLHAKAVAHANIALVKYWGKRDATLNLPAVGSISLTLEALKSETEVTFFPNAAGPDEVLFDDHLLPLDDTKARKISVFVERLRQRAGREGRVVVKTRNNFPTGAGLASSASGFAALTLATSAAIGLELNPREASIVARQGSGSAARSLFGGFVEMHRGAAADGSDAYAEPLLPATAWPLRVFIAITSQREKGIGSTEGMEHTARTSPFYPAWVDTSPDDLARMRAALQARDFDAMADAAEHSCLKMHAVMLASQPGLLYWNAATVQIMEVVRALRKAGFGVFFSIDAGPQVKVFTLPEHAEHVRRSLAECEGVQRLLESAVGPDACVERG